MPSAAAVRSSSRTASAKRSPAEQVADLVRGEPGLDAEPLERRVVAHQVALALVRAHEPLLDRVLEPVGGAEVHEPVGVEGVAGARAAEPELEPLVGGEPGDLRLEARACSTLAPYLAARCSARSPARSAGAPGSSSNERQVTSTWSRCAKPASAASKRRLPM